jgi:hypothetical protein
MCSGVVVAVDIAAGITRGLAGHFGREKTLLMLADLFFGHACARMWTGTSSVAPHVTHPNPS